MFQERLRRQVYGFGNRFVRDAPVPFLDNGLPVEPTGDLFQDIGDEDSCAAKRWLAVAHLWIGDHKSPKDFHGLCCLHVLYPFRQSLLSVVLAERAGFSCPLIDSTCFVAFTRSSRYGFGANLRNHSLYKSTERAMSSFQRCGLSRLTPIRLLPCVVFGGLV